MALWVHIIEPTGCPCQPRPSHCGSADAGAERRDDRGLTALYYAIYFNRVGAVKELLKNGANKHGCRDKNGMTPLDWAIYNDSKEILELLEQTETKDKSS